jgi:hypothetical protein
VAVAGDTVVGATVVGGDVVGAEEGGGATTTVDPAVSDGSAESVVPHAVSTSATTPTTSAPFFDIGAISER